jgi:hypothetical protein
LHGYKTFTLCLLALGAASAAMLLKIIGGLEYAAVVGAVTTLYGVNDLAGGFRDRARQPAQPNVPDTVATVRNLNVTEADTP